MVVRAASLLARPRGLSDKQAALVGSAFAAQGGGDMRAEMVSGNLSSFAGSAQIKMPGASADPARERNQVALPWQVEVYRQLNICGEARYAVSLFSNIAGRAEVGVSKPQTLARKADWVTSGPEVDVFNELAPTVRERTKLIRKFMLHWIAAGECYLISRERVYGDPGFVMPPEGYDNWESWRKDQIEAADLLDPDFVEPTDPNQDNPVWEIVAVTELRKIGDNWQVSHENGNWIELSVHDPVVRMWNADPSDRMEAWSPLRSLLPTLQEIEWLTKHIFTQVKSRLMSAGVWFLPDNLTFPPPPPESIQGGEQAIAQMNEAQQFMASLAIASSRAMGADEVSFPTIVMGEAAALEAVSQEKLIKFWSEIDDKAMILRSDGVRRFALGMDMPPEQILGSSGLAVTGAGGSAGSVNHWGVWANEEQTISAHVEPALDEFTGILTVAVLQTAIHDTKLVIAYDTASLRMRQDRSKEAMEWYDRGQLSAKVALRETGFDPETDMMGEEEWTKWMLTQIAKGSPSPEQMTESLRLLGIVLKVPVSRNSGSEGEGKGLPGRNEAPSLDDHPRQGPPQEQHDHSDAPFSALAASAEGLVLRALEKTGNRLLNDGKRGKDRDWDTPKYEAHLVASVSRTYLEDDFDFDTAPIVFSALPAEQITQIKADLAAYCAHLYNNERPYSRRGLTSHVKGL